jgi:hypothetical protein
MPKEPARRQILCPRCDAPQEVAKSAKSVLCPSCHRNISTADLDVDEYCARIEMYTAGLLTVGRKGTVIAEVRAEDLLVRGEVRGPVNVRRSVVVEKGGKLLGNVTCASLAVAEGSHVVGMIVTGPRAAALVAEVEAAVPR